MNWIDDTLVRLQSAQACGYHQDSPPATEPTALVALALVAHDRASAARAHVEWLADRQTEVGRIGIDANDDEPGWATALAVIAMIAAGRSSIATPRYATAVERAISWMTRFQGSIVEKVDGLVDDPTVKGWPWVEGTHAWVEPTAMNLLALKHTGHGDHPRARSAVRLLHNRMLSTGGCNYGNTVVMGQQLRPHLQPTGVCLLALAGESDITGRAAKSIDYLLGELSSQTTTASLCYGLLGLAAQQRWPKGASDWLAAAHERTIEREASSYKLALLALAALETSCLLIPGTRPMVLEEAR